MNELCEPSNCFVESQSSLPENSLPPRVKFGMPTQIQSQLGFRFRSFLTAIVGFVFCFVVNCVSSILASEPVAPPESVASDRIISFELEVQPILTARGCNQGACHGKQRGQNGFQLSLLGFDSEFDFNALAKESRGRRVFPADPYRSLLITKALGLVPHGGGKRLEPTEADTATLAEWIRQGMPRRRENEPSVSKITVSPAELILKPEDKAQLTVTVFYSDGTQAIGNGQSAFQSNDPAIANVSASGELTAGRFVGETAVMARYMQHIAVCKVVIPRQGPFDAEAAAKLPRDHLVDRLVWDKLQTLRIAPSAGIDDAKFLRRVYTDIIGRIPTSSEARQFLQDETPNKRELLVDQLLASPEYADHWAGKWMDLLRPNPYRVGIKAVLNYDNWIREQFRQNRPYDQFVMELLTAKGSTWETSPVAYFRDRREPDELATITSQLFLGIRLECAKCHHHPFEKWGQDDFYAFAAYFSSVANKGVGLSPPISGGEEIFYPGKKGQVTHPLTGKPVEPDPLVEVAIAQPTDTEKEIDLRDQLMSWMTAPENRFFAQVQVNRIWNDLMGRGLVEPVDDIRTTNPASNELLLDELATYFRANGFDQKKLIRLIATSQVYALSSLANDTNAGDHRNYSRHYRQRLRGEVLVDSISQIAGVSDSFEALPKGSNSKQIWTTRIDSISLDTFGRPDPNQDPPCERNTEPTMTQTLHLMNSPQIHAKLTSDSSRAAELAKSSLTPVEITDEIYLTVYSRFPSAEEAAFVQSQITGAENKRQIIEDVMWALVNTPEFSFQD